MFQDDSFTVRTRTPTIQPPQNAIVRLGATRLGGGLEISSPDNELEDVIDGVKLTLQAASDEPVTITIRGDVERALEAVHTFAEEYNQFAQVVDELTKFDPQEDTAGPLLGNRDVATLQNQLVRLLVDPVNGLPEDRNMLVTLGLKLNDQAGLDVDQNKLRSKVEDDFGAVADLFRNKGQSTNSSVAYVGISEETRPSPEGYEVDITQAATRAQYATPALPGMVRIDESNNRFYINVDGRRSEELVLEPGLYSLDEYATRLQDAITNDKVIGSRGVQVQQDGNRLRVFSGRFGSRGSIAFEASGGRTQAGAGLLEGEQVPGLDVAGTIDGQPAEGVAQLLRAPEDGGDAAGLRLLVKLSGSQLDPEGPEATVTVTKGVASRVDDYLTDYLDPIQGPMKRIQDTLNRQIETIDEQLERMEERIDSKRERLQQRFGRLESQMSQLKSQQQFLQGQLAGLPSGGGGGGGSISSLLQSLPQQ